jgi:hypothetical protein
MTFFPMIIPLKQLKFVRLALQTYYNVNNFQEVFEKGFLKVRLWSQFDIMGNKFYVTLEFKLFIIYYYVCF